MIVELGILIRLYMSESAGLEVETSVLIEPEHQVHVLQSLAAGTFKQIVYD